MRSIVFIILTVLALFFLACNQGNKPLERDAEMISKEIGAMKSELKDPLLFDAGRAEKLITLYREYTNIPSGEDSLKARYLFEAADLYVGLGKYRESIGLYNRILKDYNQSKYAAESLFLVAFVYDVHWGKKGKAKGYYEQFIEQYPNHPFALDAKQSIALLGMSDAEIIELFEKQNQTP